MLASLKGAGLLDKKSSTSGATAPSKSPFGSSSKSGPPTPVAAGSKHHHHHVHGHHHKKKKKKSHDFDEVDAPLHHQCATECCGLFLTGLSGIHVGCGSVITCGICFDKYSEKQEIVVPEDEHDLKCQPDTKVLSWISILVIIVGLFAYLISISFEELPMYIRVEYYNEGDCKLGTVAIMEYVSGMCGKDQNLWIGDWAASDPTHNAVVVLRTTPFYFNFL